jgi:hypothetical protein
MQSAELTLEYVHYQIERNPEINEVSIRSFISQAPKMAIINAPFLSWSDWYGINKWKALKRYFAQKGIPFIMLTASSEKTVSAFKTKFNFDIPVFINDAAELKTISRSNPTLLYFEKGVVRGKFTRIQTPSVERFRKEFGY